MTLSIAHTQTSKIFALTEEEIARRRNPISEEEVTLNSKNAVWTCSYCGKRWSNENFFMKHTCLKLEKANKLKSPMGQKAYQYYAHWMRINKRSVPPIETFLESKFFTSFFKFAEFVVSVGISDPDVYINVANLCDFIPNTWRLAEVYKKYLEYKDKNVNPFEQVINGVDYLIDASDKNNKDIKQYIEDMSFDDFVSLVRKRIISGWFLFRSIKLKEKFKSFENNEQQEINKILDFAYVLKQFDTNKQALKDIDDFLREVDL